MNHLNISVNKKLTKKQQKLVELWYSYALTIATSYASKNNMWWCIDDLISITGLILIKCVIGYQKPDMETKSSFKTYLYLSLQNSYKRVCMIEGGWRKLGGKNSEWQYVRVDFDDNIKSYQSKNCYNCFEFNDLLDNTKLLKESDRQILRSFFIEDKSLTDIGKEFGLSRERIRQKKVKALNNIRKVIEW